MSVCAYRSRAAGFVGSTSIFVVEDADRRRPKPPPSFGQVRPGTFGGCCFYFRQDASHDYVTEQIRSFTHQMQ